MTRVAFVVRVLRTLVAVIAASVALVGLSWSATIASAASCTYDAPVIARDNSQVLDHHKASSVLVMGAWEGAAKNLADVRGTSTTSSARSVATEAGSTVRHYTTSEAAESIVKGGEITPGSSGKIWVTPDEYLDGVTAQSRLALNKTPDGYFEIPMCRVGCPSAPSTVQPWGIQLGGGIEITTTSPIDITGLPFKTFGPR